MPSACATAEELCQLLDGACGDQQTTEIREHLAGCAECLGLLDQLSEKPALQRLASSRRSLRFGKGDRPSFLKGTVPFSEPELTPLLEKLRASPPTEGYLGNSTAETADTSLTFLAAPEHEGDLGMLGAYRVLAELGRGGMGIVLLAYDQELRRTVALKVLPLDRADNQGRARFVREARAAAGLDHDHIVPVYAVANPPEGPPYLVMPYIEGPTLGERIKAEGRLDPRAAARIGLQVAEGLTAAHRAGLVHRDIKPANIIIDRAQGRAKIMDFGLARVTSLPSGITQAGAVLGTPEYMSPEQVRAPDEIDGRTDVYSLGVTLYEALTGEIPFRGTAHMILQQVLGEDPRPPRRLNDTIARDLETICLHCMEKERGKRYASAAAVAEDLERFLAGKPIWARPTTAWERTVKWARRRPGVAALLALVVCLTASGFGLVTWQWLRAEAAGQESADQARQLTHKAKELADKARELEIKHYVRNIALAASELGLAEAGQPADVGRVEELLDDCPKDLRGWEWGFLQRRRYIQPPRLSLGGHVAMGGNACDLAFSPDGRLLATAGSMNVVTVWDAASGREVFTLPGHSDRVVRVCFSADRRWLASGGKDGKVILWDIQKWRAGGVNPPAIPLEGHAGTVLGLTFNSDSSLLASAGFDQRVKLWDTTTGAKRFDLPGQLPRGQAVEVAFSPDGRYLACPGPSNVVQLWDVKSGQEFRTLTGHTDRVFSVVFSADGKHLASTGSDHVVRLWAMSDVERGKLAPRIPPISAGYGIATWSTRFSPDGRRLAVGSGLADGTVRIYDTATGKHEFTLQGHIQRITSLAFSPDGGRLASSGLDATVRLWELETGQEVITLRGHKDLVGRIVFDQQGKRLASSSEDGTVRVWDGTPYDESADPHVRILRGHAGVVYGVDFSRDDRYIASAGLDNTILIWDGKTGERLFDLPGHTELVFAVAFSADSRRLASASADKTVKIWDLQAAREGRASPLVRTIADFKGAVLSVAWSPDGRRLLTCSQPSDVRMWDVETGHEGRRLLGHEGHVFRVAYSPDGIHVGSSGADGTARLWNADTGEPFVIFCEHKGRVHNLTFSPDGLIASGDSDWKVKIWDPASKKVLREFEHSDRVHSLAFSPDGCRLAAASWKTVQVWDVKTGESLFSGGRLAGIIWSVRFSPDGQRLAACGGYRGRGEIKIWDANMWDKTAKK